VKFHFGSDANIVHRIDQETSGLLLCSKNKESERTLKMMFENREVEKSYMALVEGEVKEAFLIDAPIHRHHNQDAIVKIMM
ncbi:pseudouridine synthase, partial [Streptococcus pseudopneumoniae]